jgi:beta-lactamase regulating signal transducer with metallopeptidase domain
MRLNTLLSVILNMSLNASIAILLVLAARLLLKRAPKIFSYAIWAVVFFRLVCPVSFSSQFSLTGLVRTSAAAVGDGAYGGIIRISANNGQAQTPQADLTISDEGENIDNGAARDARLTAGPIEFPIKAAAIIWLFGIGGMLTYGAVSLILLRRKLIGAVRLYDNVYLADHIITPFVIGVFKPGIYLPSTLREDEQSYVILHERTHIRRLDHIVKILAFLALAVHWFNPLVWAAFVFAVRDMEMSCDESVLKRMGGNIREAYSASLLSLATGRRLINGSPPAFGEGSIRGRIRNIMNFKKPSAWVVALSMLLAAVLIIGLAANGTFGASDTGEYKQLFMERFKEARKVGMHYTTSNCRENGAVPDLIEGGKEYYLCGHYKTAAELRAAAEAVFTENLTQGFCKMLESGAFLERDGRLYIAPRYLSDASVWKIVDTVSFKDRTTDTFLWDTLTVTMKGDSIVSYTLDWYGTFPGDPLTSVFTLVKGEDGVWRFSECFREAGGMLTAFVDEGLTEAEARILQSGIEQNSNVKYAEFETGEEALERFMDAYGDKSLFENIDAGVLRHRYYIYFRDSSLAGETIKDILQIEGIAMVNAGILSDPYFSVSASAVSGEPE